MHLRRMELDDLHRLEKIHRKYFDNEFSFEEFIHGIKSPIIIEEDDCIILGAGIRNIIESVAITNQFYNPRMRREALLLALNTMKDDVKNAGYDAIHCFVQDEQWMEQLKRYGFKPTKGNSLFLGVK